MNTNNLTTDLTTLGDLLARRGIEWVMDACAAIARLQGPPSAPAPPGPDVAVTALDDYRAGAVIPFGDDTITQLDQAPPSIVADPFDPALNPDVIERGPGYVIERPKSRSELRAETPNEDLQNGPMDQPIAEIPYVEPTIDTGNRGGATDYKDGA
mgnify:CR=1 FL=1